MNEQRTMKLGPYEFAIHSAEFRFITQSWSGPGWDFTIKGTCNNDDQDFFPYGARISAEAAPLPMAKSEDYTGIELDLPLPYDDDSGEPFFGINVMEEHPISEVHLRFSKREGDHYLIEFTGMAAETVLGQEARLDFAVWAKELPDHAYPFKECP